MKKDINYEIASVGIIIALMAIGITLLLEAISLFIPFTKIPQNIIGLIYGNLALLLFYVAIKMTKKNF
jgi:hypothetical protein